jgi:hypothetical protein
MLQLASAVPVGLTLVPLYRAFYSTGENETEYSHRLFQGKLFRM